MGAERHQDDTLHYYVFFQVTTPCPPWPCADTFTLVACQDGYPLEEMSESEVEQAIALHIACSALNLQVASPAVSLNWTH